MKRSKTAYLVRVMMVTLISSWVLVPALVGAGSLEPSGAPAPTMKTLDQTEPRIPIPGSATAADVYTISQSGSYYLTGDRFCSGTGIDVEVDDVTIDLMGYRLEGSGAGPGFELTNRSNVEIRNGIIRGFSRGIYAENPIGKGNRVIAVRIVANVLTGIHLSSNGNLVKECIVEANGNSSSSTVYGIYVNANSKVTGNTVTNNGASATAWVYGLRAYGNGCLVTGNTVNENGDYATSGVSGLATGHGSMVANNTIFDNGSNAGNRVLGIITGNGSTVRSNSVYQNGYSADDNVHGIYAGIGSTVTNNTVYRNGISASGDTYGIHPNGNNLVDQNTTYYNGTNIRSCSNCTFGTNHAP